MCPAQPVDFGIDRPKVDKFSVIWLIHIRSVTPFRLCQPDRPQSLDGSSFFSANPAC